MATYNVVRVLRSQKDGRGNGEGLPEAVPVAAELLATTNVSAAMASNQEYWVITAIGGAGWAKFGVAPTASAGNDWYLPEGIPQPFSGELGQQVSVIDA